MTRAAPEVEAAVLAAVRAAPGLSFGPLMLTLPTLKPHEVHDALRWLVDRGRVRSTGQGSADYPAVPRFTAAERGT